MIDSFGYMGAADQAANTSLTYYQSQQASHATWQRYLKRPRALISC